MSDFHSLTVAAVTQLTSNSVALSFTIPASLKETFSFTAGQYITIKHTINNKEVRRAYSISSAPSEGDLTVGIKKVEGGAFSTYANRYITAGDVLEVMPPEGRFVFTPGQGTKHIAAFAAGSGITPMMSIAKSVLADDASNTFVLVYGNKSVEEAMFYDGILKMKEAFPNRFFAQFVYSKAKENDALHGRIDASVVDFIVKDTFKNTAFDGFYLCGPEAMINSVSDTLKNNGVNKELIHFELFTASTTTVDTVTENVSGTAAVKIVVDDEDFSFEMDKKEVILDAILKKKIDAPYSCQGGVCSSCIARVTEGKAEMVKNQILTDSEIAEGLILTCQAHAVTDSIAIDFDDV